MSDSTRRGIAILASSLVLGALGDGLLRVWPWGLNVPLWILGSSLFGAQLAAELGLPYSFASHFAPDALMQALQMPEEK